MYEFGVLGLAVSGWERDQSIIAGKFLVAPDSLASCKLPVSYGGTAALLDSAPQTVFSIFDSIIAVA